MARTTKRLKRNGPPATKGAAAKKVPARKAVKGAPKAVRIYNCVPSPSPERDWTFDAAVGADLAARAGIPPSTDLRQPWWTIGDQKATGSCVGWAAVDSVIRWHLVQAGRLARQQRLSPRFVWMAAKETDQWASPPTTFIELEGTSLKAALDIARKFGTVLDADLPFGSGSLYPGRAQVFYARAAQRKIASYFNLGRDLGRWRSWIATAGPILTRLSVDPAFENLGSAGKLARYGTPGGGHAVALVGYAKDHFIVRNSWGTGWGDRGFAYASNAYASAAFTEAYGVTL